MTYSTNMEAKLEQEFILSKSEQKAYLSALACIANADGHLDAEEINFLNAKIDSLDVEHDVRKSAKAALVDPPEVSTVCRALRQSDARFALFLDAMAMAYADGVIELTEEDALNEMSDALEIDDEQFEALVDFFFAAHEAAEAEGRSKKKTQKVVTEAAAGLASVGVPSAPSRYRAPSVGFQRPVSPAVWLRSGWGLG